MYKFFFGYLPLLYFLIKKNNFFFYKVIFVLSITFVSITSVSINFVFSFLLVPPMVDSFFSTH